MIETLPSRLPASAGSPLLRGDTTRTPSLMPHAQRTIQRTLRDDQICVLTFDRPDSSANIFDRRTLTELDEELDFISGSPEIKGVILTSAKRSIFIAGADLKSMSEASSPDEVRELIELG